jgi:hypothetical protein
MKKTIYNVAVLMESQEQCNRMKQLCIDNGLPIWEDEDAFEYDFLNDPTQNNCFRYSNLYKCFAVWWHDDIDIVVSESEFIELLKQEKA